MIGVLEFDSRWGLGIFLFTTASRTAMGPTQPPIQCVTGNPSLGVKRPVREADHSPPPSAEDKECVELYIHSPNTPSWRGSHLKNTRTTLPRHEDVWGKGSIAPRIPNFGTRSDEWSATIPSRFIPREEPPVPIGQEARWAPEPVSRR
jgi:hypothetical protein